MTWKEILGMKRIAKGIFWTRAWSLASGCTPVSPGCKNCWLRDMAHRFPRNYPEGICTPEGQWTGKVVVHPERLDLPLKTKKPQVWAIWSDLFHEDVPESFIDQVLDYIGGCPQHIFLAVTKRPQNIQPKVYGHHPDTPIRTLGGGDYLPNLYYVFTAENQEQADKRLPIALQIPAAKRIVLYEPALGPLDLTTLGRQNPKLFPWNVLTGRMQQQTANLGIIHYADTPKFDGVIAGGETGPHARPTHPDWFLQVRDDCQAAGVPFFLKSLGEHVPALLLSGEKGIDFWRQKYKRENSWGVLDIKGNWYSETSPWHGRQGDESETKEYSMFRVGKKAAGRFLDGRTWEDLPA